MRGGWCSNEVSSSYRVGVLKNIRRGCGVFSRFVRFEVGDGSKIRFWQHIWCDDQTLKAYFPALLNVAHF
jgi:hypothetical protein